MSEGLNRVHLLGSLGADPELRQTSNGESLLKMRLATTEKYRDRSGQLQETTEWHTVVTWGKRAEGLGGFLSKGHKLFVEGKIQTRSYQDREGTERRATEVRALNVIVLGGKGRPQESDNEDIPW